MLVINAIEFALRSYIWVLVINAIEFVVCLEKCSDIWYRPSAMSHSLASKHLLARIFTN